MLRLFSMYFMTPYPPGGWGKGLMGVKNRFYRKCQNKLIRVCWSQKRMLRLVLMYFMTPSPPRGRGRGLRGVKNRFSRKYQNKLIRVCWLQKWMLRLFLMYFVTPWPRWGWERGSKGEKFDIFLKMLKWSNSSILITKMHFASVFFCIFCLIELSISWF